MERKMERRIFLHLDHKLEDKGIGKTNVTCVRHLTNNGEIWKEKSSNAPSPPLLFPPLPLLPLSLSRYTVNNR